MSLSFFYVKMYRLFSTLLFFFNEFSVKSITKDENVLRAKPSFTIKECFCAGRKSIQKINLFPILLGMQKRVNIRTLSRKLKGVNNPVIGFHLKST